MTLPSTEPVFGPFRSITSHELTQFVDARITATPSLILVDGRSGSGKSTFAEWLARRRGSVVIATDDVAWHLSPTEWADAMIEGIIRPWARGEAVACRPPGWVLRGRDGHIAVPAGADLIVEGVGAARLELAPYSQMVVWVQADRTEARRRGIERDVRQGRELGAAAQFWDDWMHSEEPFLEAGQPWTRADLVIDGTSSRGDDIGATLQAYVPLTKPTRPLPGARGAGSGGVPDGGRTKFDDPVPA